MIRKLMLAAAVAVSTASMSQLVEAKTRVFVDIGLGGGCLGNPYACNYGPGWDDGDYYGGPAYIYDYRPRRHYQPDYDDGYDYDIPDRISCREARSILRERGWRNVQVRECGGASYTFTASRRGSVSLLRVSSRTGRIISVRRLSY
jgi:hypothetical protein